nr:MAG TPA: hypothetical protein [Caudoviricetes sp.]
MGKGIKNPPCTDRNTGGNIRLSKKGGNLFRVGRM